MSRWPPSQQQALKWTLRTLGLEQTLRAPGLDSEGNSSAETDSRANSWAGVGSGVDSWADTNSRVDSQAELRSAVPIPMMSIAIMGDVVNSRTVAEALMLDLRRVPMSGTSPLT